MNRTLLATTLAATLLTAGCLDFFNEEDNDRPSYQDLGFDGNEWPDLEGAQITVLDHGAFGAFQEAKKAFERLTNATVIHVEGDDAGTALQMACLETGGDAVPTFDVIYGIDNILLTKALNCGAGHSIFEPYTPLLANRINAQHVFFQDSLDDEESWPATPVDHGYIAVNVDDRHQALENDTVLTVHDLVSNADHFVTQDPRTSTPGLGFLLATIDRFPETNNPERVDWKDYWNDLFASGLTVTTGWTEAYEGRFSGGYGWDSGQADKPIVTSYSTSPAYEWYWDQVYPEATGEYDPGYHYESDPGNLPRVLLDRSMVFHQIETMGIVNGTPNLAAAQAWIEFTLTDEFQDLMAEYQAVYPVVSRDVSSIFSGLDPTIRREHVTDLDYVTIGSNLQAWLEEWVEICEAHDCT